MPLPTGKILNNRYRIVKLLGQGGFGAVYRAWDTNFQMPCALKENTETSAAAQRQFMREATMLHTLRHESLPLVKDYFQIPGQGQYLVMDFVDGDDLQTILDRRAAPLAEEEVLNWLSEICTALEYLHTRQPPVIHRDIKPANIKITPEGRAVLVDFGISKVYDPDLPTTQGARAVTPGFSPFEQYGNAPTDSRTDIYALGATAYNLLTGLIPPESISRMAGQEMPSPIEVNHILSENTSQVILTAMKLMPNERFTEISIMRASLKNSELPVHVSTGPAIATQTARIPEIHSPTPPPDPQASPQAPEVVTPEAPAKVKAASSIPAAQAAAPVKHRRRSRWPAVVFGLLVAAAIGIGAVLLFGGWIDFGSSEEPSGGPIPEEHSPLNGDWVGFAEEYGGEQAFFDLIVHINHNPGDEGMSGVIVIVFPDGHGEEYPFEGPFDGERFRFIIENGWHFQGHHEGEKLMGEIFHECFDCEAWAYFEWYRE